MDPLLQHPPVLLPAEHPGGCAGLAEAGAGPGLARVTRGRNRWLSHEAFGGLLGSCPVWFPSPPPPRKVSALRQKLGND